MPGVVVSTEHSVTHRQFLAARDRIEVLIGGQSDVKTALAPQLIDRAGFNYADTGESPIEGFFKMRRHLDEMPNLRVFMYSLALPSFVGTRTERLYARVYRRGHVTRSDYPSLKELGVRSPMRDRICAVFECTGKSELMQTRRNIVRRLRGRRPLPPVKGTVVSGFRYSEGSRVDPRQAASLARHHFSGDPLDPIVIGYFERMLRMVKERGVTVVTVAPPVTDVYLEAAKPYLTVDQLESATVRNPRFEGLIDQHIDMTTMFADRHELFRNQNHMNAQGAEVASRHVAAVLGPIVRPGTASIERPADLSIAA